MKKRTIKVEALARVEGEGALYLRTRGREVEEVRLDIFEPPRFFEAFLRGREYKEVPDITARICGICPVAYQMSSIHAVEDLFEVKVSGPIRALRRMLYCGEWIESHALHVLMLHAPDFLRKASVLELAQSHPELVERGLQLKKAGNEIVRVIGGREVHPINVKVGGFYRPPRSDEMETLREPLQKALETALELVTWVRGFDFPDFSPGHVFVAMRHPEEYPMNEGRLVSSTGLDIPVSAFLDHFHEYQVPHSNALHCLLKDVGCYHVGPVARLNLNADRLTPLAAQALQDTGLKLPLGNPFHSIVARAIEIVYALEEALRLLSSYRPPEQAAMPYTVRAGTGQACTEAPRGILFHRYTLDSQGLIQAADLVPPTSQNQARIEADLKALVPELLDRSDRDLTWACEHAIRNYDPCISCATHFLRLDHERR
jgi:coenzyme F420-reducing hydrogenase alpha subunit